MANIGCGKKKDAEKGIERLEILSWTGCGISKKAYIKQMAKAFEKKTGLRVNVTGGGATKGIRFAAAGKADVGGGCRHKIDHEAEKNAQGTIVAWDALVVIVHKKNPITNISSKRLKLVLTGKIKNWKKLGGKNAGIDVLARDGKNSGVGRMARELIFNAPDLNYTPDAINFPSSGPLERSVEKNINAIAITGISSGRKRKVKFLKIDGRAPTYDNIASGRYPFFRPLYLYTSTNPGKNAKNFIAFASSAEGQKIIKEQKTVNVEDAKKGGLYEKYDKKMKKVGAKDWQ